MITTRPPLWYILATLGIAACGAKQRADTPVVFGDIGLDRSMVFLAADPEARWIAYCQAESPEDVGFGYHGEVMGPEMNVYLTEGTGIGRRVDDFLGSDPTGRFLALVEDGHITLHDVERKTRTDLTAAGAVALGERHLTTWLSFDAAGHMLYVRRAGNDTALVLRTLGTGEERELDRVPGPLAGAMLDPSGAAVHYSVVDADTNGNGSLDAPEVMTNLASGACRGPARSATFRHTGGDDATVKQIVLDAASPSAPDATDEDAEQPCDWRGVGGCEPDPDGRRPVAIARDGRRLMYTRDEDGMMAPRGPMRWVDPPRL